MKGHIRKRGRDTYTVIVDMPRDHLTGKRCQKWYTVNGKKRDADKFLRDTLLGMDKGLYVKNSRITFGEWLRQWLKDYVSINTTPRTMESYQSNVEGHIIPALGRIPLLQLEPQNIQTYYADALINGRSDGKGGLSARSVLYHHRIIGKALRQAVNLGLVARNVVEVVHPPRQSRPTLNVLEVADIPKLLDILHETPYYVYYSLLLYTGLRRGEGLALRWKSIDLIDGKLQVVETAYKLGNGEYIIKEPKTAHSRRSVSIPVSLNLLLLEYRGDQVKIFEKLGKQVSPDDFVFVRHDNGLPLDPNMVTKKFSKAIREAKLPHLRLHDLRHTHATLMLKAGIHPKIVSERLGHANISITLDTYSHVLPGLQDEAAERFDRLIGGSSENENKTVNVSKMLAETDELASRPYRSRTCDTLIKSQGVLV